MSQRADIRAFGCVLSGDPDWDALPEATPTNVRRLLERCLTRDVRRRLRDIGEARVMLEDAVGVVLFAAGWLLKPSKTVTDSIPPDRSVRRLTFEPGLEQEPTLSPDGNYVAYSTDRAGNLDIEILPLGGGNVTRITDHPLTPAPTG